LNKIKLATFQKHGLAAQEAARAVMQSASRKLAGRHYRLEDELPHLASFVGGPLRYPYYMSEEKTHHQFTPNFYRTSGVIELIARDFMLKHAFGAHSEQAVEKTASERQAVIRFIDEFHAAGDLSDKMVHDLEDALGAKKIEKLQERIPEAQHGLDAALKKFLAGEPRPTLDKPKLRKKEQVRRMRVVERLRNATTYVALPFMMLELRR